MNSSLRTAAALALWTIAPPATAQESSSGLSFSAGAGVGPEYGLLGAGFEVEARHRSGAAIAANLGVGAVPTVGLDVWSPGSRARLGLGVHTGVDWATVFLGSGSGDCMGPGSSGGRSSTFLAGARVAVDHDIGAPGAWGLRYGVGADVVAAGCAGGILPTPVIAAHYTF